MAVRILMISDVYFPRVNGVSTSIAVFRQQLASQGHEVMLIAPDYPGAKPEPGVRRIPSRYLFVDPEDRIMRARPVRAMVDELRAGGFDLVHIQTPFVAHRLGLQLARKLQLPVVETYHTYFEEYLHAYLPWLPRAWLRRTARNFTRRQCNRLDAVVTPSSAMAEVLRRYGVTAPVEIIPTGIVLDQFQPTSGAGFRAVHGIAPARPVLLYVGRVAYEKNIGFLLQVTAEVRRIVPDVLLVIAGEGPATHALKRQVADLALEQNVTFVGYLRRDGELQACYCAADLFVFASRTETQGLVLLEAMALGLPVVASAIMGTRDVLRDGEGAAVVEDETAAFARAITALLSDRARRQELSRRAQAYAQAWGAEAIARRMVDFYRQIVAQHARGAHPAQAPHPDRY